MPLVYDINPQRDVVTVRGDYADPAAWRELLTAILNDPHYHRGMSFIRDLRDSTHPVDAQTVAGILTVVQAFWKQLGVHRAAIVMGLHESDPALIAHALAEDRGLQIRAFTHYDDAVAWVREK